MRETSSCLCEPDYTGILCDQLDCGCTGSRQCSGNGVCVRSSGADSEPICKCDSIWEGKCCEICPPVASSGDPHLHTIDGIVTNRITQSRNKKNYFTGLPFDYFGIGEFVSCYSIANDFGVQLRFFKYKNTSMIGAAAVKIGEGVATIVAVRSTKGQSQMPVMRYIQTYSYLHEFLYVCG